MQARQSPWLQTTPAHQHSLMPAGLSDTGATRENNPLHIFDDKMLQALCAQCLREPPPYDIRVGVLTYNWQAERLKRNIPAIASESALQFQPTKLHRKYTVKRERYGERPRLPLDRVFLPNADGRQKFYDDSMLHQEGPSLITRDDPLQGLTSSFQLESTSQAGVGPGSSSQANVLRFSLAVPLVERWRVLCPMTPAEMCQKIKNEHVVLPVFDHKPLRFGLCYHQIVTEVHKHYSDGSRFLNAFPDGSAHVLYPSGLLAVIVVPSKQNGNVCIVYDDVCTPHQPMRAIFHSNGRALCNHGNGQIWLILNGSGGQCFTDMGASVCRWDWSSRSNTPTPLHPIFLSLNKMVGVRVLEKNQVFVCFLAKGKQAKFNVGPCCVQCESKVAVTRPLKLHDEELQSIMSRFQGVTTKLLDCIRTLQCTRLREG